MKEAGPSPVALDLIAGRNREQRLLPLGFRQRLTSSQEADQSVGRGPLGAPGIEQYLFLRRPLTKSGGKGVEAAVVEVCGDLDDPGHGVTSSPRRCRDKPLAPRYPAFLAASAVACCSALSTGSPASSRANAAAPKTSPQPVGSRVSITGALMSAVRTVGATPPDRPTACPPVR